MERISLLDDLFLWLERRSQPLHVAGLLIFEKPKGAPANFISDMAEFIRQYDQPLAPFNQRLVSRKRGHFWKHDSSFDLDHHFRHVALPKPGGVKELLTFVSIEHSNLLDRSRPLWESYLIEQMHGRHFAMYNKVHHSVLDGVSGVRATIQSLSTDAEQRDMPPFWQMLDMDQAAPHEAESTGRFAALKKLSGMAGRQVSSVPTVVKALYQTVQAASKDPEYNNVFKAPPSKLNQPITGSRRFVAQSYERARLKVIATQTGSTTNDIVLALCATALRNYLASMDSLPGAPLIAMVPVSLRTDDSIGGNQVAAILANLGTHKEDPLERLNIVKDSVQQSKAKFGQMSKEEIVNYTALSLAPTGLTVLTGLLPKWLAFNVVISSVPGTTDTLYWNGAKVERYYPVSAIVNQMALNITLVHYEDRLEFGIVGCRRTLPSMQRLLGFLDDAISELEAVVGIAGSKQVKGASSRKAKIAFLDRTREEHA